MIGAFFAWWLEQLADLLPSWLRRSALTKADALVIAPAGPVGGADAVEVGLRRGGREAPLGRFPLGSAALRELPHSPARPVALRLHKSDLLEKTLSLPLAAQADLDQVLLFEMDRETPFAPDELYWNHRIEAIDRQHGRLAVRLFLLPRAAVAGLLAALAQAGIAPGWAEIAADGADGPGELPPLPLDNAGDRRQHPSRRLVLALAVCCALLAVAAAAIPFVRQAAQLAALDRELQQAQATAAQAEGLRREIDQLSHSADLVKGALGKAGRPLAVLAAVTRLLPDDTYLTEMQLRQRKLTLLGRSAGAARLIGVLAADGEFKNPGFAAPVTRIEALHAEVFTIVAEVEPQP